MKKSLFALLMGLLCCAGCSSGGTLKGQVVDAITNEPVMVSLTATTETDVVEQKKKANLDTTSSKDGSFTFKGCLPNKEYSIKITDPNYLHNQVSIVSPDKRLTKDVPVINVVRKPLRHGVFLWDKSRSNWTELEHNITFNVSKIGMRSSFADNTILDLHFPLMMDKDKVIISDLQNGDHLTETETFNGQYSQIGILEKAYRLDSPTLFAFYGDDFTNYELMGLFYYPEISIYDSNDTYPGTFNFAEGYHAGMKSFRGAGQCCRYLDLKRDLHVVEMRNIATHKIGGLVFGRIKSMPSTYNVLVPGGKLDLYQSKGLDQLLAEGLPGVVFTMK